MAVCVTEREKMMPCLSELVWLQCRKKNKKTVPTEDAGSAASSVKEEENNNKTKTRHTGMRMLTDKISSDSKQRGRAVRELNNLRILYIVEVAGKKATKQQ